MIQFSQKKTQKDLEIEKRINLLKNISDNENFKAQNT